MNENPAVPSNPASLLSPETPPTTQPIGEHPDDRVELPSVFAQIDAVLRHPRRVIYALGGKSPGKMIFGLVLSSVIFALCYGLVMGSFSGGIQLWAASIKTAAGLFISALICLPSLYIFACLSGSRARLIEVVGLLSGLLTLLTLLLIGFAPVAWIFSRSINSLPGMGFLHLVFWLIAAGFGIKFMVAGLVHLGIRTRSGIKVWCLVFILVNLQMSTALRPLIGQSPRFLTDEKRFFVFHWLKCADQAGTQERANPPHSESR